MTHPPILGKQSQIFWHGNSYGIPCNATLCQSLLELEAKLWITQVSTCYKVLRNDTPNQSLARSRKYFDVRMPIEIQAKLALARPRQNLWILIIGGLLDQFSASFQIIKTSSRLKLKCQLTDHSLT